jgi:autotransporter-associated beta strand protein
MIHAVPIRPFFRSALPAVIAVATFVASASGAPYTDNFSNTDNLSTFNELSVSVSNNVLTASRTELLADSGVNWQPNGTGVFSLNPDDDQFIFSLSALRPINSGSYVITAILRDINGNFVGELMMQPNSNQTGFLNYDMITLASAAFPTATQWFPRVRILPTSSSDAAFEFGSFGALAAASSTLSSGTMLLDGASALGSSAITLTGGAELLFTANRTVTNGIIAAAGGSGVLNAQSGTSITYQGETSIAGTLTVDGPASTDFSGTVSGAGTMVKTGAGTATLSGASANTFSGTTTVNQGVLELAKTSGLAIAGTNLVVSKIDNDTRGVLLLSADNQVDDDTVVTLSGGTIRRASGVSEVFGNLSLTETSFIDFGTGSTGTLSFGTYTPSSLLTVQNFLPGNKLQFTSTLTSEQLSNTNFFSFGTGFTTGTEGDYFTITAIPETPAVFGISLVMAALLLLSRRPAEQRQSPR